MKEKIHFIDFFRSKRVQSYILFAGWLCMQVLKVDVTILKQKIDSIFNVLMATILDVAFM